MTRAQVRECALISYGLLIDDYYLTQEESVTGEKLATKYALLQDEKSHDVAGVSLRPPDDAQVGHASTRSDPRTTP